jgi:hypothetical protein
MMHDISSKPNASRVCRACGVELRLVTIRDRGSRHAVSEVQYRKPGGEWQTTRIPCRKKKP